VSGSSSATSCPVASTVLRLDDVHVERLRTLVDRGEDEARLGLARLDHQTHSTFEVVASHALTPGDIARSRVDVGRLDGRVVLRIEPDRQEGDVCVATVLDLEPDGLHAAAVEARREERSRLLGAGHGGGHPDTAARLGDGAVAERHLVERLRLEGPRAATESRSQEQHPEGRTN
jgi:hypothetical protein